MTYLNTKQYKIIWSSDFLSELDNIYNYLIYKFKEPQIAKKLKKKITTTLSSLQFFPSRHLNLNNFLNSKQKNLHKILIDNYVLIYKIDYNVR